MFANCMIFQGNLQEPLQETLEKINMLEQNAATLDKQTAGIQKLVTEVVKKQEEHSTVRIMRCNDIWTCSR